MTCNFTSGFIKLLLVFSIALLPFARASAQTNKTLNGIVKDDRTGETLIGATIKLSGKDQISTITNSYGFYSVNLPEGEYLLQASYIGYRSVKQNIVISKDLKLDFSLKEENELDEVVISSVNRNDNVSNPQMGVEKANIKEIRSIPVLLGERDILKTLQLLPGVKSAGEGNTGFYVRGGSTDQNLILLDEAPVYNASHLLGFFSTFNSDAIKDATLFKGGMPSQYGSRLASVLDIKMNEGNKKEFTVEGGLGLIASRVKLEGPIVKDKGSFMISGRRTYLDAFLKLSSDSSLNSNGLYFYDLNAKANYQIDGRNTIYLSGYFGRDKLLLAETFGFSWGNTTGTLRWNHLFSNRLFSNTSLIYSNYNYTIRSFVKNQDFIVNSDIRDFNLKQDFQYALNNKHNLKFGMNAIHHTISPGKITASEASSVNRSTIQVRKGIELAAYISDDFTLGDKLKIMYGARLTSFNVIGPGSFKKYDSDGHITDSVSYRAGQTVKNYLNAEPRVSVSYQLDELNSIKASYARNTQSMHLMSNSTITSPTDLYIMNSNNVKPEIADQVALGVFKNFSDAKYEFSTEVYYKWMQNQIEYKNGTDLRGNKNVEADLLFGDGRAYGIELLLKKKSGNFSGWAGYTLSRTERQFDAINKGNWFPAKQDIMHDLSLVGIYKAGKRWTLSTVFLYNTGNAVTFPSGKYQLNGKTIFYYDSKNGYRTPAYHRMDFSATLEAKTTKKFQSSWMFGLYNLYNHQNAYTINFKDDPDDSTRTQVVRTTLFGIIPSVTWNFKF